MPCFDIICNLFSYRERYFLISIRKYPKNRPRRGAKKLLPQLHAPSPWILTRTARLLDCTVFRCSKIADLNIVRSIVNALRDGFLRKGACSCGSKNSAPSLSRLLWYLSCRHKKDTRRRHQKNRYLKRFIQHLQSGFLLLFSCFYLMIK